MFAQKMSELGLAHSRMFPSWDPKNVSNPDWEDKLDGYKNTIMEMVKWADVVVCQYVSTKDGFAVVETIRQFKPCLMEMDDFFKQIPGTHPAFSTCPPGHQQDYWASAQLQASSGVICSTQYLADSFKGYNEKIYVIPNCIDYEEWDKWSAIPHEKVRIGWIGGASHGADLALAKDAIYDVLNNNDDTEAYIVSCPPPEWKPRDRLHLINKWATIDKYPKHVKELSFDIGLVPLRDNLFNRAKSNLRYQEYSACKIPTIASYVEPHKEGFKGYSVNGDNDWEFAIRQLVALKGLREKMGKTAYDKNRENFNLDMIARKYAGILESFI